MFKKIKSLEKIANLGLNMHKYYIPKTYYEFTDIVQSLKQCTIRTDHEALTDDLPFYIGDTNKHKIDYFNNIWVTSMRHGYKLIVSDGIKYDNIQEYNMTVKIEKNGDFIFEASELKIPLRHMYRHPLLSCCGNISEDIHEWTVLSQKYGINKMYIRGELEKLYTYGLHNQWLEVTKYPINVGIKNEKLVFWEIK